jgi:hypothetical protein
MITQAHAFPPMRLNRNELASYGLLVLVGFAALLLGISRWYATPRPQLVTVGHQRDLALQPQPIAISSHGPVADKLKHCQRSFSVIVANQCNRSGGFLPPVFVGPHRR